MCERTVSDEPIDADDLLEDPRADAEALCLCALLWAPAAAARQVVVVLTAADFQRSIYGELFETIAAHVRAGTLHDPASIAAHLTQTGRAAGHHGTRLSRALSDATTAGAGPEAAGHYARAVVAAAYRRGFYAAGAAITQAAAELPQDQLFDHLVSIGRERRTATERLDRTIAALN
jgi:replicative DNA helicase